MKVYLETISFSTIPNSKAIKFPRLPPIGRGPNQGTYEGPAKDCKNLPTQKEQQQCIRQMFGSGGSSIGGGVIL
jgi:hypothetical protein